MTSNIDTFIPLIFYNNFIYKKKYKFCENNSPDVPKKSKFIIFEFFFKISSLEIKNFYIELKNWF